MKKTLITCVVLALSGLLVQSQPLKARIKIDAERIIGEIDPLLYGNFTEHLGRCIYGGIYDPTSPQANKDGFRNDVIDATKNLGVSIVRWPGGNFASGYHWMDGIGPRENRPKRKDLAWGDTESNLVGTDEFLKFTTATGAQPYFCVNLGTGSWDEARNWVEYCNAKTGFYYSDLRAKNGHPEPYHIKYWGLGNEIDGPWQMGHRNATDYSAFALEAAKLMKWSDDSIKLIASGSSNYGADWVNWNRTVLNALYDQIDYISLHHYAGNHENNHEQFMASTLWVEDVIRTTEGLINEVRLQHKQKKSVYIAFDEYNVWYRAYNDKKLEEHYNMQDVLVVAMYLNTFIRHANIVKMANMAQLVNVIAPMMITDHKLWLQTIYYPLQLFATNCVGQSLDALVQSDHYDAGSYKKIPYLDVSAAYNPKTEELMINVVNRHPDKSIETEIVNQFGKLAGQGTVFTINSPNLKDENSASAENVKTSSQPFSFSGEKLTYTFPAHSFTMIKIKLSNSKP